MYQFLVVLMYQARDVCVAELDSILFEFYIIDITRNTKLFP